MPENTLYFGDNLIILRDNIRDETVDLIYLDPPFDSKANYNVHDGLPHDDGESAAGTA